MIENPLREPQRRSHLRGLGACGPATGSGELLIKAHITFHRLDLAIASLRGHFVFRLADTPNRRIDTAHGKNTVTCEFLRIARVSVLRQVTNLATARDLTGVLDNLRGDTLPRKQSRESCLTGTVTADQSNPHAFIDTEIGVDDELTGTDPHRKVLGVNHAL